MSFFGLFGPPNIEKLEAKRNVKGLIKALRSDNSDICKSAVEALGRIGKPAVEPLIAALKDKNRRVRQAAAKLLGEIGDARAVEPLIAALKKDGYVRQNAATALEKIGGARTVEALITALKDEDENVRTTAATTLGEIGDDRAVEPLITALKDEDENVRTITATALGQIGDACAVEPLIAALKDTDNNVCGSAATALGKIGDARAVEPLITILADDTRKDARMKIISSVDRLNWNPNKTENKKAALIYWVEKEQWDKCATLGELAVPELVTAYLRDKSWRTVEPLKQIGTPYAIRSLLEAEKSLAVERLNFLKGTRSSLEWEKDSIKEGSALRSQQYDSADGSYAIIEKIISIDKRVESLTKRIRDINIELAHLSD